MRLSARALTGVPHHRPQPDSETTPSARSGPGAATTSSPASEAPHVSAVERQEAPAAMEAWVER